MGPAIKNYLGSGDTPPKPLVFELSAGWPISVYALVINPLTEAGIAPGRKLFYDSHNGANSKYDKVKAGNATFILPESPGYEIFETKCATCHQEPLFTDGSFRNTGIPQDAVLQDAGRQRITRNPADFGKFKVN